MVSSTRSHFISINYQGPPQITKIFQSLGKFQGFRGSLPGTWTKIGQVLYHAGVYVSTCLSVPAHTHACVSYHAKDISASCHAKSFIIWLHPAFLALPTVALNSSLSPGHHALVWFPRCTSCPHCLTQDSFKTNIHGHPHGTSLREPLPSFNEQGCLFSL